MAKDYAHLAKLFLELRSKAAQNVPWTRDEEAIVEDSLRDDGVISVLAACCTLSSERRKARQTALAVLRAALDREDLPPYVELLIYEALLFVNACEVAPYATVFRFIERSIAKRAINLDNTICLIAKLAEAGQERALALLNSMARDSDPEVSEHACSVLQHMKGSSIDGTA